MVFTSYVFMMLFLPSIIILYFILPEKFKNPILLIYSLIFYGWNSPKYLILLLISIAISWLGGYLIDIFDKNITLKKVSLFTTVMAEVLLLGYFKYAMFAVETVNSIFKSNIIVDNIVLPIGISFFVFQGISYIVDVYRKQGEVQKNPLNIALYISMFPQLVAGPIVRYQTISDQIKKRNYSVVAFSAGLERFIYGFAKKIILADTFGSIADTAFATEDITMGFAWIGAFAYTLQIYFDFSGYSDMAIGLGKIFGFDFCENFNYPYIAKNIREFWKRWHMSLTTWFRDYVYIPLGGNRVSVVRNIVNVTIVWFLTGLWHGAAWNFVLWGVYYCILNLLERFLLKDKLSKLPSVFQHLYTMFLVVIGWTIFRCESLTNLNEYFQAMFSFDFSEAGVKEFIRYVLNYGFYWILAIILCTPIYPKIKAWVTEKKQSKAIYIYLEKLYILIVFGLCILYLISSSYNAFIYFQF